MEAELTVPGKGVGGVLVTGRGINNRCLAARRLRGE